MCLKAFSVPQCLNSSRRSLSLHRCCWVRLFVAPEAFVSFGWRCLLQYRGLGFRVKGLGFVCLQGLERVVLPKRYSQQVSS